MAGDVFATDGMLAAWLLTYAVHSTLILALVWWLTKLGGADRVRESLWKAALVASLFSATMQVGFGVQPFRFALGLRPAASATMPASAGDVVVSPNAAGAADLARPSPRLTDRQLPSALWLWAIGSTLVLGVYCARRWRLGRQLDDQREIVHGPLVATLRRLGHRMAFTRHVRLMASDNVSAPVAYGILEPRIVLPKRALTDLDDAQLESMLAHELAHLRCGDPAWLLVCRVLEAVFFFQPLNYVARRKLQELAEYRCDAWAVSALGANVPLASCLVEVASWLRGRSHDALVPAMASSESSLSRRVHRLLEESPPMVRPSRWWELLVTASILLLACAVPGFSALDRGASRELHTTSSLTRPSLNADTACAALDVELTELDAELGELRSAIATVPDPDPYLQSLHSIVSRARELRAQRARLNSWMPSSSSR